MPTRSRAGQLVVRPVADEHGLAGLDAEQLRSSAGRSAGSGLASPTCDENTSASKRPANSDSGPDPLDVLGANGDQPDEQPAPAQLAQRLDSSRPRHHRPPDVRRAASRRRPRARRAGTPASSGAGRIGPTYRVCDRFHRCDESAAGELRGRATIAAAAARRSQSISVSQRSKITARRRTAPPTRA